MAPELEELNKPQWNKSHSIPPSSALRRDRERERVKEKLEYGYFAENMPDKLPFLDKLIAVMLELRREDAPENRRVLEAVDSTVILDFLEEMGIECVGMFGRWAYLRRRCDDAPFDLFSDIDSKIKHLRRIDALLFAALALQLAGLAALFHMREYPQDMLPFAFVWLALVALVGFGFVRIARKADRLKRERTVRE